MPDFPDKVPAPRTVWLFRESSSSTGKAQAIWKNVWEQFEKKGITIKKGTVQDATFIESDPGKHGRKKPPKPEDPMSMPAVGMQAPVKEKSGNKKHKLTKEERRQAMVRAVENKKG